MLGLLLGIGKLYRHSPNAAECIISSGDSLLAYRIFYENMNKNGTYPSTILKLEIIETSKR